MVITNKNDEFFLALHYFLLLLACCMQNYLLVHVGGLNFCRNKESWDTHAKFDIFYYLVRQTLIE